MKYLSLRWLITIFLILGIIFVSIGFIKDSGVCQKTIVKKHSNSNIDSDTIFNNYKAFPKKTKIPLASNIRDNDNVYGNFNNSYNNEDEDYEDDNINS